MPRIVCLAVTLLLAGGALADQAVYEDALAPGWVDWSWGAAVDLACGSPVHTGAASIAVTYQSAWAGLFLHLEPAIAADRLTAVRFWIHGGTGGQRLRLAAYDGSGAQTGAQTLAPLATGWVEVTVPLTALGSPASLSGLVWQDTSGGAQARLFIDDVVLVGDGDPEPPEALALRVIATAGVHMISPYIYGMNWALDFPDEPLAAELRLPVRRRGGNATTRYNWLNDTANRASDWFFENVPEANGAPGALPVGSDADRFVEQDRRTDSRTLMTVPLIGFTPKERAAACGFAVSRYGPQQEVDPWRPDCGNGVRPDGTRITGNDPSDTSIAIGPSFVADWVAHLIGRFGTAAAGGVRFYGLDNEPMLWSSTHRDVHPEPTGYDEMRERTIAYAAALKAADPTALTLGPVVWGWTAYFWSALDWAAGPGWWSSPPDRLAHGNVPFLEWYLREMRDEGQRRGVRLLDFLTLHFYPPGVALEPAGDAAQRALRLRSTRLLWDRSYTEESWIAQPVYLIPRMHAWVGDNYPGTGLAITEYNWGALDHINGALAQADVLGIFGRERLDLATLWGPPRASEPGAFAFRMYRTAGGGFGEIGAFAESSAEDRLAVYAARRQADGALTVIVINKTAAAIEAPMSIQGYYLAGDAEVYRYSAANLSSIVREPDAVPAGGVLRASYPAESITLLVMQGAAGPIEEPRPTRPVRRRLGR